MRPPRGRARSAIVVVSLGLFGMVVTRAWAAPPDVPPGGPGQTGGPTARGSTSAFPASSGGAPPDTSASPSGGAPAPAESAPIRREAFDGSTPVGAEKLRKQANLPELLWDPAWHRFTTTDLVITGVASASTLTTAIISPLTASHRRGGILFDEQARKALAIRSVGWRYTARDASDVMLSLSTTFPFFGDALLTAWWFRGNADVARQMALIDLETLTVTTALQGVANVFASRERPYGRLCGGTIPEKTGDCEHDVRYRSFFSGHTSVTFASAGLVCSHHLHLRLFGDGPADELFCAVGYAVAATTGVLRIAADMHYASDVMVGASIGTIVGLGVPWLHYRRSSTPVADAPPPAVQLSIVPTGPGAALVGVF